MKHYIRLAIMTVLMFVAMYILMYAMVSQFSNVFVNLNQVYMAGLMACPMVLIELVVMRAMYQNAKVNAILIGSSTVVGVLLFVFIQQQTAIGDRQFLRSMIPHHSAAILMCREASIQDARIRALCQTIVAAFVVLLLILHLAGGGFHAH